MIRQMADLLVEDGYLQAGYSYLNLDGASRHDATRSHHSVVSSDHHIQNNIEKPEAHVSLDLQMRGPTTIGALTTSCAQTHGGLPLASQIWQSVSTTKVDMPGSLFSFHFVVVHRVAATLVVQHPVTPPCERFHVIDGFLPPASAKTLRAFLSRTEAGHLR